MTEQSNTFEPQNGAAPRHGRHASSLPQNEVLDGSVPSAQDVAAHSRHAAVSPSELPPLDEEPFASGSNQAFAEDERWGLGSDFGVVPEGEPSFAEPLANNQPHYEHDLSGLSEYAYGAPVEQPAPSSYSYGVSDAPSSQFDEVESVLPDKLRSKNGGAPRKVLKTVGKIILILVLFGIALGLGVLVGLVNLMDVNPLVLFALS